jgi:hypothetical protein
VSSRRSHTPTKDHTQMMWSWSCPQNPGLQLHDSKSSVKNTRLESYPPLNFARPVHYIYIVSEPKNTKNPKPGYQGTLVKNKSMLVNMLHWRYVVVAGAVLRLVGFVHMLPLLCSPTLKTLTPLSISANPLREDPKKTKNPPGKGLFEG